MEFPILKMLFVPPGGKHIPGPGRINLCDQNQSREKLDWNKPFYCSQDSWLHSSPLAADLASPSRSMLASPPAPSWRNSEGRSPATDWHQTNYTTEGRTEQHLSTPCPRSCGKKHLLIYKWLRPGKRFWKHCNFTPQHIRCML